MICLYGRPARMLDGARRYRLEVIPRVEMQSALRALCPPGWRGVPRGVNEVVKTMFVEGVGTRQSAAHVPYLDGVHTDKALLGAGCTVE